MANVEKSAKTGFVIKLSTETVQKLSEEESNKVSQQESKSNIAEDTKSSSQENLNAINSKENNDKNLLTKNDNQRNLEESRKGKKRKSNDDQTGNSSWGAYQPYVTYEGETAIYTDPTTQQKYIWCSTSNNWVPKEKNSDVVAERVYSYENDTHVYTDPDGSKFFWDIEKKAWLPKVDDDFLAYYQMSYGFVDNSVKDDDEDLTNKKQDDEKKKDPLGVKRKSEPQWFEPSNENNTKVYVSNLPLDLTEEEFVDFMQKCGLVMRDPSTQKMKIKLYKDKEHDCFKGDALCTYIKVESVDLALKLLDGSDLKGNKVKVERAHFQLKGEYNPALKPKKKKKKELDKIKKMQEKLFDWRPEKFIGERSKHEKVVILKNVFHPTDFDKEVQLILDFQQDLREECSKCGEVKKVVIYDRHPDGVAQVTMKEPEQADAVVALINGRWFGKRKLTAEIWDGKTKYKIAETDAEINNRLKDWGKFLEAGDEKADATNKTDKEAVDAAPEEKTKIQNKTTETS